MMSLSMPGPISSPNLFCGSGKQVSERWCHSLVRQNRVGSTLLQTNAPSPICAIFNILNAFVWAASFLRWRVQGMEGRSVGTSESSGKIHWDTEPRGWQIRNLGEEGSIYCASAICQVGLEEPQAAQWWRWRPHKRAGAVLRETLGELQPTECGTGFWAKA